MSREVGGILRKLSHPFSYLRGWAEILSPLRFRFSWLVGMQWIAPSELDSATCAMEKRFWDAADLGRICLRD
jgi:hypothetical protein